MRIREFTAFLIVSAGLLTSCSKPSELLNASPWPSEVRGAWKLQGVRCNGTESPLVTDSALADGTLESVVTLDGESGSRTWNFPGCKVVMKMSPAETQTSSFLRITETLDHCNGDGCGGWPDCTSNASPTSEYPFQVTSETNANTLQITLPDDVKARGPMPCDTSNEIVFVYQRQ